MRVSLFPLSNLPEICDGDDLATLLWDAAARDGLALTDGILVVCQKIVSKAEGRVVRWTAMEPSAAANALAVQTDKDARFVEVVLRESRRVVRSAPGVLICETHHGFVCANAGVDQSNAPGPEYAVLLPRDPDSSAEKLRAALCERGAGPLGIVISDSFGRPWREGQVDVALGCAGFAPLRDQRGQLDRAGRPLAVTAPATADQLAAAAGLLMDKAAGVPAVWIAGLKPSGTGPLRSLLRDPAHDLFR